MGGARPVGARTQGDASSLADLGANHPVQQAMRSEPEARRPSEALPTRMHRGCRRTGTPAGESKAGTGS